MSDSFEFNQKVYSTNVLPGDCVVIAGIYPGASPDIVLVLEVNTKPIQGCHFSGLVGLLGNGSKLARIFCQQVDCIDRMCLRVTRL